MNRKATLSEAAKALFDEGKKIREAEWGPSEWVAIVDNVLVDEAGDAIDCVEFWRTGQYEIVEDPPVMAGDTFYYARFYKPSTYTVRYVDDEYMLAVSEEETRSYSDRVEWFNASKATGWIKDHKRNGKPVP